MKLTNADTLQSDAEGIALRSCSLSRSHSIIDDISPDAYWYMHKCNMEQHKKSLTSL